MATARVGGRDIHWSAFSIRRLLNLTDETGETQGGHRDDLAGDSAGNQRVVSDDKCGDKRRHVTISANKSEGGFYQQKSNTYEQSLSMFRDHTDADAYSGHSR